MSRPQPYEPYGYYHGNEADQYTFYRLPKALFVNPRYKNLSDGAKVLYGLMLDRMGLSIKNSWLDEQDRVYIYFTLEDVQEFMNCQHGKAVKMLSELDTDKGIGLIERVKRGQGKPTIIYVRKFFDSEHGGNTPHTDNNIGGGDGRGKSAERPANAGEVLTSEKRKSKDTDMQKCRLPKNGSQDFRYSERNNNDLSNNDFNDIDSNDTETHSIPIPPQTPPTHTQGQNQNQNPDRIGTETDYSNTANFNTFNNQAVNSQTAKNMSVFAIYREIIHENIEYDHLKADHKYDRDRIDEIVDLMLETVCTSRQTIRISSDDYPAELVKAKFLKLNPMHIEYVLECLKNNTTEIRNIKKYLLAVLFNAPSTMDSYYTSLVAYDMASGKLYGGSKGGGA